MNYAAFRKIEAANICALTKLGKEVLKAESVKKWLKKRSVLIYSGLCIYFLRANMLIGGPEIIPSHTQNRALSPANLQIPTFFDSWSKPW